MIRPCAWQWGHCTSISDNISSSTSFWGLPHVVTSFHRQNYIMLSEYRKLLPAFLVFMRTP
jgi:hypothetical protein